MSEDQVPLGRASSLELRRIGDTVYTQVKGDADFTFDFTQSEAEVTSKDDQGEEQFLPSSRSWTCKASVMYLPLDPGQELLWEMMFTDGMQVEFRARFDQGVGHKEMTGKLFPTAGGHAMAMKEGQKTDFTMRVNRNRKGTITA